MEYAAPTFLKTLEGINAKESEHVVFECKIVGEPIPEIKWFKVSLLRRLLFLPSIVLQLNESMKFLAFFRHF